DDNLATGPSTFSIFEKAKGTVRLTTSNRYSGYRSVEIRDVAGDGTFPELQGYFPEQKSGKIFTHFAIMITNPQEPLNLALAGPEFFVQRKNGIGFWLKTEKGFFYQVSAGISKKLFAAKAFAWYLVDILYDIDGGVYDLTIHEQGVDKPIV